MEKIKVGILGTGNIGTDLLYKVLKSEILECSIFAGRNPESSGIELAKKIGIPVSFDSIHYFLENPNCCDIAFDATSAQVHIINAPILKKLGIFAIDLTPAHIGKFCIPVINLEQALKDDNINMVTCGGQASVPIAYALSRVHPEINYLEVVASIASKSAGLGTRNNIDEFTQTTGEAIKYFTGINKTKAIIILNPAEPPVLMKNTIYALLENPDMDKIKEEVSKITNKIAEYVPGYKVITGPLYENGSVTTIVQVTGSGDYLPEYAGNLDIITCAAVKLAEEYARERLF
jgi:acetaldehyde dehydrogenase